MIHHTLPPNFRPMLAGVFNPNTDKLDWNKTYHVQPKIDGIRCIAHNGQALSRTLKPIRNKFIQAWFKENEEILQGLDGELIVGNITDHGAFQNTTSGVMSEEGEPDFKYYVFDTRDVAFPTSRRLYFAYAKTEDLKVRYPVAAKRIVMVETTVVATPEHLKVLMDAYLAYGYEGAIIRESESLYKYGRSTLKQGSLLKWKMFEDAEGIVIGFEEKMHNDNEKTTDNLGLSKRSSHKGNKRPAGTLGALICKSPFWEGTFNVGTGFTDEVCQGIWDNRDDYAGKVAKFKFFPIGEKDKPRHATFLGFRDFMDIS